MKIVKTASGKNKIKMSRREWTDLGKKAGWMKEANDSLENCEKVNCCKKDLYCTDDTNTCSSCGKIYNMFGQQLSPRSEWEDSSDENF